MATNPYVGPRPFEAHEREFFFGRGDETEILAALVLARRAALFYAQSGAGKSSLLRAGLVPMLTERTVLGRGRNAVAHQKMQVLPIAAVGDLPGAAGDAPDVSGNFYVQRALASLYREQPALAVSGRPSLAAGLAPLLGQMTLPIPTLLIFDQFEELFTENTAHWREREGFFLQVAEALEAYPALHVVFSMREDHIAWLVPYAHLLPESLRPRFRLEGLKRDAAILAVRGPAERAGRPYAGGVAEALVDNLRGLPLAGTPAADAPAAPTAAEGPPEPVEPNEYVEPVHLQVVCQKLWEEVERTEPDARQIETRHVQDLGGVDEALQTFYEDALATVSRQSGVSERRLRTFFESSLITPAGSRALIYRDPAETAGLPNAVLDALKDCYVLRAETSGRDVWYRLSHDRLVAPVKKSNAAWRDAAPALQRLTTLWLAQGKDESLLLRREALADAQRWASEHPADVEPDERELLQKSERARRRALLVRWLAIVAAVFGLAAVVLLWIVYGYYQRAVAAEQEALSRQLSALSRAQLSGQYDLALLLANEANDVANTLEAQGSLLEALRTNRDLIGYLPALAGGNGSLASLALSQDGKAIAAAGERGVVLWQLDESGKANAPILLEPSNAMSRVALSPDGAWLAAGREDGLLILWDLRNSPPTPQHLADAREDGAAVSPPDVGRSTRGVPASPSPPPDPQIRQSTAVYGLAFTPDSRWLVAMGKTELAVWDGRAPDPLVPRILPSPEPPLALGFDAGGSLVTVHAGGALQTWNLDRGAAAPTAPRDAALEGRWVVGADAATLAVGGSDGRIWVWDRRKDELRAAQNLGPGVQALALSGDGTMLASGDIDGGVTLWNLDLTVAGRRLGAHARAVTSLAFSPRGFLVSAGEDGTVIIWRTSEGPERLMHALIGHGDEVWAVAFGSEERLISGSKDGGVLLWDLAAPDAQPVPVPVAGRVHVVAFGPDGRPLIVTDRDGTMLFWDGGTSPPRSFDLGRALNSDFANVRLSPAGDALAYGRADGTVILWDLAANPPASRTITGHTAAVRSVIFSPDGTKLYSGDSNGTIRVWDREGKQAGSAPGAARAAITQLAASPAGEWIAAATDVQTVVVWDLWQQSVQYLPALGKPISSLAFYPRDRLLASADTGGSVQLWDVVEGRRIGPVLRDAEVAINQLAFGPDGMHLAGASDSHVVFLWDLDLYAWQQLACAIANRNLTIAEWQQYFGSEKPRATCSAFPVPGSAQ